MQMSRKWKQTKSRQIQTEEAVKADVRTIDDIYRKTEKSLKSAADTVLPRQKFRKNLWYNGYHEVITLRNEARIKILIIETEDEKQPH